MLILKIDIFHYQGREEILEKSFVNPAVIWY